VRPGDRKDSTEIAVLRGDGSISDLFGTDQPEGRVLGEPLGVAEVFVTRQATIHGLPQQVRRRETAYFSHGASRSNVAR
jgi:hypothetical protein